MKFKGKITKQGAYTKTRLRLGGDTHDPQGVWDSLVGWFSNLLGRLLGHVEFEREVKQADENFEVEIEGSAQDIQYALEPLEGPLRQQVQADLADEAQRVEHKKLEAGRDPQQPMAGTPEQQHQAAKALHDLIEQKRREGYEIDFRKIESKVQDHANDS